MAGKTLLMLMDDVTPNYLAVPNSELTKYPMIDMEGTILNHESDEARSPEVKKAVEEMFHRAGIEEVDECDSDLYNDWAAFILPGTDISSVAKDLTHVLTIAWLS
jgi:hypothetical protein